MLLELEGGIPFSYSGDWTAKGRPTSWNGTWRLQFAEGSIHLEGVEESTLSIARCETWRKNPTVEPVEIPQIEPVGQAALLKRFADAIRSGTAGETSGADNLWSFGAVMAGVISARESRAVDVRGLLG
jgi:predicted dehydrogenase